MDVKNVGKRELHQTRNESGVGKLRQCLEADAAVIQSVTVKRVVTLNHIGKHELFSGTGNDEGWVLC